MKSRLILPAAFLLALLPTACSKDDRFDTMARAIEQQNKTIIDQQQTLLDQQQKLIDQEVNISILAAQLAQDEAILKKLAEQQPAAAPDTTSPKVDEHKVAVVKLLTGFNARLSANIGYGAYADALSDLHSSLIQYMLDMKDQNFIDEINRVLCLYDYAGDFWQRFSSTGISEISLSATDRYKYSDVGVNFVDSYNPRPTDVKKFWLTASDEIQKMLDYNSTDLGRDGTAIVRLFGR